MSFALRPFLLFRSTYGLFSASTSRISRVSLPYSERQAEQKFKVKDELDSVAFPPDRRKLHPLQRTPATAGVSERSVKYTRRHYDLRGPETVENTLIHSQYGIQALEGGELKIGHLELIRLNINRAIDEKRMFAIWRVPGPWKPKTQQSLGKRMGGGKADIHHYVTPVRADRIIVEVGGYLDWREAHRILGRIAAVMPFRARFVSQNLLDTELKIEAFIAEQNVNPFYPPTKAMLKNYAGCRHFLSPWHMEWQNPHYR
ncbi:unnamed protein product [Schistocephalus solidus]|uniref:Large ribosomal subunit protein uL16m n=2 Tax=Schistocephalus solidus TaxID=70667 RepID=A0A183TIP7_SCHSO|nr:unnamed protein product [Schistocephalus solidus]